MPATNSRPVREMPSLVENDETDAGVQLGQPSNMMDVQPNSIGNGSNTPDDTEMVQEFGGADDHDHDHDHEHEHEQDVDANRKRKCYHRHTQYQIQELEAYFKECPHPDDKQRKDLSRALGLAPLQIKFWFQNKRTQMKNQHEKHENTHLRAENETIKNELMRYKEALANLSCPTCGGQRINIGEMSFAEHQLRLENTKLKEQIERISTMAGKQVGDQPLIPNHINVFNSPPQPVDFIGVDLPPYSTPQSVDGSDPFNNNGDVNFDDVPIISSMMINNINGPISEVEKPFVIELLVAAMDEFIQMAHMQEPLWFPSIENGTCLLNEEEYFRVFPRGIGPKPIGFSTEASKETTLVMMNHLNLVGILMDVNHWSSMFSCVVSRASTIEVLSTGAGGNYNGAIQVILAETQVASPQVPTRECYFARYCKHRFDGTWAVVDVSLDHLRGGPAVRSRKRPSGCLIEERPNGGSKVTWIEHVEVDDSGVHNIYKPLVNSGLAFGAKRWVTTLERQCNRLASALATPIPTNDISVLTTQESRKSMLKLAERMVNSFTSGVSASAGNQWTTLSSGIGTDEMVRVMTRQSVDDPGKPPGVILSAATSFWLPIAPKIVFDFLRNENTRNEWDILSNGGMIQQMGHIANGIETGNCVSLLRVNSNNVHQSNMLILQESSTDATGSYVIYAPVDVDAINLVLNGGDPDFVALLASGFAILPDGPPGDISGRGTYNNGAGGSLLTIAFQILVDSLPTAKLSLGSVATVNKLIAGTVNRIKNALLPEP